MSTITNQPGSDNPGRLLVVDGGLESAPGTDLGLFYRAVPFDDYILNLEWLTWRDDDNSGIFVRFPDVTTKGYNNTAFVAVDFGFEVQIDALEVGRPASWTECGQEISRHRRIYNMLMQNLNQTVVANGQGQWNQFEIRVKGNRFKVFLNQQQKTDFVNTDPNRGQPTAAFHFIGLQRHTGHVLWICGSLLFVA